MLYTEKPNATEYRVIAGMKTKHAETKKTSATCAVKPNSEMCIWSPETYARASVMNLLMVAVVQPLAKKDCGYSFLTLRISEYNDYNYIYIKIFCLIQ